MKFKLTQKEPYHFHTSDDPRIQFVGKGLEDGVVHLQNTSFSVKRLKEIIKSLEETFDTSQSN